MCSCLLAQDHCTVHKIQTFISNVTSYLLHQEVHVELFGHCSVKRNKVANNDTPDIIPDNHHQFALARILADLLAPWRSSMSYSADWHFSSGSYAMAQNSRWCYSWQELIDILLLAHKLVRAYCIGHPPLNFHQCMWYSQWYDFV